MRHVLLLLLPAAVLGTWTCTSFYEYDECQVPGQCSREDSAELCSDGVDNDGDSLVDCFDPSCKAFCTENTEGLCSDGIDNDGDDGRDLADCDDPDCGVTDHCTENTEAKCTDGVDNNLDGVTDCADRDCCGTKICHELEVCGELILDEDFSTGIDEARWLIHEASSGYRGLQNGLDVNSAGLTLHAQTACYTYREEVGIISREPLDLTRGRYFITARMTVLPDTYWPAYLALVPHVRTGEYIIGEGGRTGPACGTPMDADPNAAQNPVILHNLYGDGTRNIKQRFGAESAYYPPSPLVFPSSFDKEDWEVRMDIDDEEIVLFESEGDGWVEVGRAPNLFPGRRLHLAMVASTDSNHLGGQDNRFSVQHVAVYRYEIASWTSIYADNFDADPGWSGTNPDHCAWDAGHQAMGATFVADSGETCLATLPTPWEGQSFRLRYDMLATRVDDAAHFAPLLYDASASFEHGLKAGAGLNRAGTSYNVHAFACAERQVIATDNPLNRWLRATVFYDAARQTLEVDVIDRDSAEQVAWSWTSDATCLFDFRYFGFSVKGYDRYAGQTATGLVDNVTFMVREGE
jgi:hypothetical protein